MNDIPENKEDENNKELAAELSYKEAYKECLTDYNSMSNFPQNSMFMCLGLGISGLAFLIGRRFGWSNNAKSFPILIGGFTGVIADNMISTRICDLRCEKLGLKKDEKIITQNKYLFLFYVVSDKIDLFQFNAGRFR